MAYNRPAVHGVLILDKPEGLSSAAAVDKVKRAVGATRAGHGGTLDPMATGVLPICLGEATKLAHYLLVDDKAYEAVGVLGVTTDTLDRTGKVTGERAVTADRDALASVLAARVGHYEQVPPMFSAIKQGGVRLYHRARAGEHIERAPRRVRVDRLTLLEFAPPRFRVAIECGKGTYVRSLIADIGEDLGCGAHVAELRRTRVGRFSIDRAVSLEAIQAGLDLADRVIGLVEACGLPRLAIAPELVPKVRSGVQLDATLLFGQSQIPPVFQIVTQDDTLVAIASVSAHRICYERVFLPA